MNLTDSFYKIKLDISDYNLLALNDIARMFIIQFVVQILFFLKNDKVELFSIVFIENTLFILVGVFIYWIVFNNVILFTNKDTEKVTMDNYYQKIYTKLT